ncbi:MAG: acetyl-CoA decarbonylase/synthase complex subunit gamma [Firmicutes bacterium]|nr:acetyl-CoA decarbonylase/synthase complex subunit gamma [Bacillota bacterium]
MGLTGLEIFKHLPKTNCKECGFPTCLAFAMALANGKTTLDLCPYVSDEAKEALASASAPPIRMVKVGVGENELEMGDETEIFRHDKRFNHLTAIAIIVNDNEEDIEAKVEAINALEYEHVGQHYESNMVALINASGDAATFKSAAEKASAKTKKAFLLISDDTAAIEAALEVLAAQKPLLYAANKDNYEKMTEIAKANSCPLVVKGEDLNSLAELVEKIVALGHNDLVLDPGSRDTGKVLVDMTQIRRQAVKNKFRPFGFPTITFTSKDDPQEELLQAGTYLAKYASIVVMKTAKREIHLPLMSWRANVYTDPQKPVAVEAGAHEVGEVDENSPVYCTTNFSLTYFLVEGEVDSTRIPSYILSVDTGGISVLTAYADNKFTAETITKAIKDSGLEDKVKHRKIVLPGGVAVLKGKLEEESGWDVLVGPRESADIPKYAKEHFA